MTYKRFKQIWDTLVTNRPPRSNGPVCISTTSSEKTLNALKNYADGNTTEILEERKLLDKNK